MILGGGGAGGGGGGLHPPEPPPRSAPDIFLSKVLLACDSYFEISTDSG